jgi:hypothetical protein
MLHNPYGKYLKRVACVFSIGLFAEHAMALPIKTYAAVQPLQYLDINQKVNFLSHGNGWINFDNHGTRCRYRNSESRPVYDTYFRHYAWWLTPGVTYGTPSIPIFEYSASPMQDLANCYWPYDARTDFWVRFGGQGHHCIAP